VLRGRPNGNHWLTLKLVGTRSNKDGLGAKVRIGKQWAYATTSGSYLSSGDSRVHFGLGTEKSVSGDILWPSGKRQTLDGIAADRVVTMKEPE
jgi:enediyne biosynthesis protein E4